MELNPEDIVYTEAKTELGAIFWRGLAIKINSEPEFEELKKYLLHCQDRKVFCEVQQPMFQLAMQYGMIKLEQLPKNEEKLKKIEEFNENHLSSPLYNKLQDILKDN